MQNDHKIPLKRRWQLTVRALRLQWDINRNFFLSSILHAVVSTLKPFAAIWFSAQLVSELAGQQRKEILFIWAACAAGTAFLLHILVSTLEHKKLASQLTFWHRSEHLYAEKMLSMDYEDVEKAEIHILRSQIDQNDNYNGYGLNAPLWALNELTSGFVGIVAAISMTVSLFQTNVNADFSHQWLNSPYCIVGILLIIIGSAVISVKYSKISTEAINGYTSMEFVKKSNRIWNYYGFQLSEETKAGMDIRLYNMQRGIWNAMEDHRKIDHKQYMIMANIRGRSGISTQLANGITYGIYYCFVALKALGQAFPIGNVVQYVGAISQFSESIRKFASVVTCLLQNASYLEVTYSFLDIPNNKYMGTIPVEKRTDHEFEIEFRDVSFRYPGTEVYALKNLNFRFKLGTKLAVVGMNGSGKTTMIKLLCRLYDPTEGEILLNGINIQKYDYDEYMSLFSVVFQDFQLFSFTLGENVAAQRNYDRNKATQCLHQAGFAERLEELPLGLDTYLNQDFDKSGVTMSGGEGQKIALARALYKDAPFVVLDEPTAALDPLAEYEIYTRFNDMVGDKTAVYISHRLSSCRFCDEIAVFHQGELVQYGTHAELLSDADGKYYELWNAQAQYYISK